MMEHKIAVIKGMADILPDNVDKSKFPPISYWHFFENNIKALLHTYCYEEIRTPILEHTSLFVRSLGEVTDIVEKEMYTFLDHDINVTLRPEGTAGCVRSCIEHGMLRNQQLQRLWYLGPMFRREQPQQGRYRQFYQFGVECFGLSGPDIDAEQNIMLAKLWKQLGISEIVRLEINSIGCSKTRAKYKEDLIAYFSKYKKQLDEDCNRRLHTNPLRILDSKNPDLQALIQEAPSFSEYLSADDKQHFEKFQQHLSDLNVKYTINPRLIRGLDYYNRTVYEWVTDKLGSQSAICAGGRYDGLSKQLNGPDTFGIGFAIGIERVLLLLQSLDVVKQQQIDAYLVFFGENALDKAMLIEDIIRSEASWLRFLRNYDNGSLKNQVKKADKKGAELVLIIGDDELANKSITIKFLRESREQETVLMSRLGEFLRGYYARRSN